MTDEEMVAQVTTLVGDRFADVVPYYLGRAKAAVTDHVWPFDEEAVWESVPERYHSTAVDIAVYLVNRRGAEGETSHAESGVSRTYESGGIPASFLRGITPHVGVPR